MLWLLAPSRYVFIYITRWLRFSLKHISQISKHRTTQMFMIMLRMYTNTYTKISICFSLFYIRHLFIYLFISVYVYIGLFLCFCFFPALCLRHTLKLSMLVSSAFDNNKINQNKFNFKNLQTHFRFYLVILLISRIREIQRLYELCLHL